MSLFLLFIGHAGDLADAVAQRLDRIDVEHRVDVLHRHGEALKAHARVDVLLLQRRVIAVAVIFELREDVVPDLHIAVAVAAGRAVGLPAAVLLAAVIVHLRAGAAGACAVLPEVVLLAELVDSLRGHADLVSPDREGLVVVQIDGRIEPVRIKSDHLRQELPRPVDRFRLEIVAEGEVAQHLKECAVSRRVADIFDVAGADALLAGRDALSRRHLGAGKVRLQRRHARVDEQHGIVPVRHERKGLHREMSLALHEIEKHLSELVYSVFFHVISLRLSDRTKLSVVSLRHIGGPSKAV